MHLSYVLLLLLGFSLPAHANSLQLSGSDLVRAGPFGWIAPELPLPAPTHPTEGQTIIRPEATGPAANLLRRLSAQGATAGLSGVLYDNRDRGHSVLPPLLFPNLTQLTYGPKLREAGLDFGLAGAIQFSAITIGNSSTAVTGRPQRRSLPRLAMTIPMAPAQSFRAYTTNHLYVYPEHRDHDEHDLFPANWPYMVISQGSSGSDQAFLRALVMTLAAFRPDTRARLESEKLIAPTLQMILRRTQNGSFGPEAYRTAATHPTVFNENALSPERMISMATSIAPDEIPPLIRLEVLSENFESKAGLAELSERLFDTPSAIARVWRGPEYERRVTLSTRKTRDPNDRELEFFWVLLRGDPGKVQITPSEDGLSADITVAWHAPFPVDPTDRGNSRLTTRVDIGVIAWNGEHFSAPAFLSVSFPTHQHRIYAPGPEGRMQLASVDYDAQARKTAFDPMLHWSAPWQDKMVYDEAGELVGLQRQMRNDRTWTIDANGRTKTGQQIRYHLDRRKAKPVLQMDVAGPEDQ